MDGRILKKVIKSTVTSGKPVKHTFGKAKVSPAKAGITATGSKGGNNWMRGLGNGTTKGQLEGAYVKGKAVGATKGFVTGAAIGSGITYLSSGKKEGVPNKTAPVPKKVSGNNQQIAKKPLAKQKTGGVTKSKNK